MNRTGNLSELRLEVIDFVQQVCLLHDLNSSEHFTLYEIMKRVNSRNSANLPYSLRNHICADLEIALPTFNLHLEKLVNAGLLLKTGRGIVKLNLQVFGRGSWSEVVGVVVKANYGVNKKFTFTRKMKG
jgi:hypothetical protein